MYIAIGIGKNTVAVLQPGGVIIHKPLNALYKAGLFVSVN